MRSRNTEPSPAQKEVPLHAGSPGAGTGPSHDPLSLRLAMRIDEVLAPLIPVGSTCAMLDFPTHSNVGDSAIWLGQRVHLARVDVSVVYVSDLATYSSAELRRRLPRGLILLSGGGSLGDVWPETQRFREQVIRDFPSTRSSSFRKRFTFARRPPSIERDGSSRSIPPSHSSSGTMRAWRWSVTRSVSPASCART